MSDFISFARANGVDIDPAKFFPSQKIQRCGTLEKPRSGNGAYFWDGQRGWVYDWSGEARTIWYSDPRATPWTAEEKALWAAKRSAAAGEQQKRYQDAASKAVQILKGASLETHQYLRSKGFPDEKGLVDGDRLLISMRNVSTNRIQGFQSIIWSPLDRKYEKKMMPGMMARNAVFRMGDKSEESWLVEGYATGLSVRAALKQIKIPASVIVCFSAGNLTKVAEQIPGQRYVFADNDSSGTGQQAAEETGLPWTMSDTVGQDANDLHQQMGLFKVVAKIMKCRNEVTRNEKRWQQVA